LQWGTLMQTVPYILKICRSKFTKSSKHAMAISSTKFTFFSGRELSPHLRPLPGGLHYLRWGTLLQTVPYIFKIYLSKFTKVQNTPRPFQAQNSHFFWQGAKPPSQASPWCTPLLAPTKPSGSVSASPEFQPDF